MDEATRPYYRALYERLSQHDTAEELATAFVFPPTKELLSLAYRLAHHSGAIIPSLLWWKLAQRAIEQEIMADTDERAQEQQRVKRVVYEEEAG